MPKHNNRPVALVTGAGSGIGLACIKLLAARGFDLCLVGRNVERLRQAAPGLKTECLVVSADVANDDQVSRLAESVKTHFGRLDALVNNAGNAPLMSIEKHTAAIVRDTFNVNAIGPAILISLLWPLLRDTAATTKRATIVTVSSMATVDPFPGFFAYAGAKAAGNLLMRVAAKEGERLGIKAFAVAPGAVETQMLRALFDVAAIPKSKTLSPETVAKVIVACIMGDRDSENGRTITLPSPA